MSESAFESSQFPRDAVASWPIARLIGQALLPKTDNLEDVPAAVLLPTPDSWWRRTTKLPSPQRLAVATAWRQLAESVRNARMNAVEPLLARRPGVFGNSQVLWEHIDNAHRHRHFDGMVATPSSSPRASNFENPFGPFVLERSIDDFQFDLTDIECIANSKSSDKHFESVDAFGQHFNKQKNSPVNEAGLQALLTHREIRLIHSPGADHLKLSAWDPRLTVCNSGGSHHLAAAQMIARHLERPVPLSGRLYVRWLNEAAWTWLLSNFWVVHVNWKDSFWSCRDVAVMTGACYALRLPTHVAQGELILLPRQSEASAAVVDLFGEYSCPEVSADLRRLLEAQRSLTTRCAPRLLGCFQ
ncbi:DUF6685 family protein [Pelomonas sp. KK5]|uniref:DUF6685 family protein n=1 Tax=Pelomonas sp. KK5 TaxID=1855730 RepID=UPI001301DD66|nr:DUF6685 family protein [Pelomonas sp. KK5]